MSDITLELNRLSLLQMVLAWAFVGCYALALGGMLEARGSRRAGLLALLAASAFCLVSEHWVHGVLLVLFCVGGIGLFVAVAWVLTRGTQWMVRPGTPAHEHDLPLAPASLPAPPMGRLSGALSGAWRELWRSQA